MKLKAGDLVDIVAPSSPPESKQWRKGIKILESWGLKTRFSEKSLSPWLFHANNNKQRSDCLNQAFSNRDSSAVWMLRGGYGLQKLMPSFIRDYSKNQKRKFFIGYSDGTVLHLYLNSREQTTLHAPVVSELPDLSKTELRKLKNILFGETKQIVFKNLKVFGTSSQTTIKAAILGGNLSLLSTSLGTPWCPRLFSHFLFIEDVNEEAYKLDRMLHQLVYSGVLKGVKALLFGSFFPLSRNSLKAKVLKSFSEVCSLPIVFGLPCGHTQPNHPLPLNKPAELILGADRASLKIKSGA